MRKFRRIFSLVTTIAMLLSMSAVPQASANEATVSDEVLAYADFEEGKGGWQGQYASGNTTMLGGVDRVYTDDSHGKSYRVFSRAGHETDSSRRNQIAYVNLDEAASEGILHISYEMKVNTTNALVLMYVKPDAINETQYTTIANGQQLLQTTSEMAFYNGKDAASVTSSVIADTWYQVDMIIDFENGNATFYVDGQRLSDPVAIDQSLTGVSSLMIKLGSATGAKGGSTTPSSVYIDNFKITKVGDESVLGVDSTTVSEDKDTLTLNLTETVPAMPEIKTTDVKIIKRGTDETVEISSVTAANKKVSIEFANPLDCGTEYEISVAGAFAGLNGASANGLKGYTYINTENAARYEETFDDGETTFKTTGDGNQAWSITNTEITDYEGRGKVYRAYNTEDGASYIGYQKSDKATAGYQNFAVRETLEEDQYLETDQKYVISYSSMLNGNALYTVNSKTTYQYPKYGFALSSRTGFDNTAWRRWDNYDPHQVTSYSVSGYTVGLAAGGGTITSDKTIGHHVASYKSHAEGVTGQSLVDENRIKKYETTDDKYVRLNNGEWYDIEMVVDIQNETVDYYYDGRYVGTQTSEDGLDFDTYLRKDDDGDGVKELVMNTKKPEAKTLIFGADFGPKTTTMTNIATTVPGEYILDNIRIEEFDGGKYDKYIKSIRFVNNQNDEAFSTATVSTLNTKIKLTAENVVSEADMGIVTLTKGADESVNFTPSYADGVYILDLGDYLESNTTYTLMALGETYTFTTDAGEFKVESIELGKVTGELENESIAKIDSISDVQAGDKVRATVKFVNTTGETQTAWLSIACYNAKQLGGVMYNELTAEDCVETEIEKTVDITVEDITDLKISGFVWESKENIRPLIKNVVLE